jgi:hypothetical protein
MTGLFIVYISKMTGDAPIYLPSTPSQILHFLCLSLLSQCAYIPAGVKYLLAIFKVKIIIFTVMDQRLSSSVIIAPSKSTTLKLGDSQSHSHANHTHVIKMLCLQKCTVLGHFSKCDVKKSLLEWERREAFGIGKGQVRRAHDFLLLYGSTSVMSFWGHSD